ncbi:hypothetical protein GQR58_003614 [Nymphon striatum]|nr:hypothetical protein GQR58_003614 [Nymphon striatum]
MILSVFGIFCVIFAVLSAGKYRLQKIDGFTCFAWAIVLLVQNHIISYFLSQQDILILRPLLSVLVFIFTVISTACRRYTFIKSYKNKMPLQPSSRTSLSGKLRLLFRFI